MTKGFVCRFGTECFYSHMKKDVGKAKAAAKAPTGSTTNSKDKRDLPFRFFAKGACAMGNTCEWSHTAAGPSATAAEAEEADNLESDRVAIGCIAQGAESDNKEWIQPRFAEGLSELANASSLSIGSAPQAKGTRNGHEYWCKS